MTQLAKQDERAIAPRTIHEVFVEMALNPDIDPARIAALMELQIKAEERNAEKEFNAAFARLQPRMPRILKRGTIEMGTKGSMKFARYEDLDTAIRGLYVAEGFSLSFVSEPTDKGIVLVAVLAHGAGHSKTSRLQLPADTGAGRNSLQALGSSLSYAKRYLTCDIFNIVTVNEDDDATAGDYISEKQVENIENFFYEIGEERRPKFLETFGVKGVSDLTKSNYTPAINLLNAIRRGKK